MRFLKVGWYMFLFGWSYVNYNFFKRMHLLFHRLSGKELDHMLQYKMKMLMYLARFKK